MRRLIQVGVGGYGATWLETIALLRDRVDYAALVDTDESHLEAARLRTGIDKRRCFSTVEAALTSVEVEADSLLCVVPPALHESVVVPALDAGLHVLSEKPIAHTMEACRTGDRRQIDEYTQS